MAAAAAGLLTAKPVAESSVPAPLLPSGGGGEGRCGEEEEEEGILEKGGATSLATCVWRTKKEGKRDLGETMGVRVVVLVVMPLPPLMLLLLPAPPE